MSNPRYGSGRRQFVGQGIEADLSKLDPAAYPGAVAYSDGELWYSDGSEWVVPQDEVDISRPRNLAPTNAVEQAQLRLSSFRSPTGESQTGIIFEINTDGLPNFGEGANLITRNITSEVASLYNVAYPDDGFQPGETIWWRARYLGTNGTQSQYSIPTAQIFPDLITTPSPVTASNAITGTVTLTPFESAPVFGLQYYQTQVEFYAIGAVVGVDAPITTVTQVTGPITTTPIPPLVAGQSYQWRGRYTGRVNSGSPTIISAWSTSRTIFLGAASIVLEYDMDFVVARTIQLPLGLSAPSGEAYSVTVDWGDNTSQVFTTGGVKSKTYAVGFAPTNGRFTVTISGRMTSYGSFGVSAQPGLVRVENIGFTMGLTSLASMLYLTTINLEYFTPNLPETVTDLTSFMQSSTANPVNLPSLDTRNVTNMRQMFQNATAFNRPIGSWDTSKVTNMNNMFNGAAAFNQDIGTWNVGAVTNMLNMFFTATAFTNGGSSSISNWDVSKVTDMTGLFGGANSFNQNIGAWNTIAVTNMTSMFLNNQVFNNGGSPTIGNWNTSNVTIMAGMFQGAPVFNQPIGGWNTSNVTTMTGMFQNAIAFNQNIGTWNTGNVTNMGNMFQATNAFNNGGSPSINNWDTSKVTNLSYMFFLNLVFNQPIGGWNTGAVLTMVNTFSQTPVFDQNIGTWNTGNVTTMQGLFSYTPQFNNGGSPSINNWDVSKVTDTNGMFQSAAKFNQPIGTWNTGNVTNMTGLFSGAVAFNQDISAWNMSKVTNMTNMFISANAFNQPIGEWNVSSVTTMSNAFTNANSFNQNLGGFDLRKAGVVLSPLGLISMNQENYSRTLIGWANYVATTDGPHDIALGVQATRLYNANNYVTGTRFTNAVAARAFLVGGRAVSVTGSSDTNANTTYTYNGTTQTYDAANGWKFAVLGTSWALYNASAVLQATGTGTAVGTGPHTATSWTGVLSAATVLRTGASWTITGDAAA